MVQIFFVGIIATNGCII